MATDDATFGRQALNVIWTHLPFSYSFDDWVEDRYADGASWEQIIEEMAEHTATPEVAPDGLTRTRPTLMSWYPHLRRRVPSEYAQQPTGDAA